MKTVIFALIGLFSLNTAFAESQLADAIQNGNRLTALELINEGADVNATQGDGTTPLHWAVYKVDAPLVERLLASGADASAQNQYGSSPLAEAVKVGHIELVEMLLEAGADPESANLDGQTALMLASRSG